MLPLFVHHHLGMGDHIICNGLVRTLLNDGKTFTDVFVFAKQRNAARVARMFDDDPRIHVLAIPSDQEANEIDFVNRFIAHHKIMDFLRIGFTSITNLYRMGITKEFDEAFYSCVGIPYDNRWSAFRIRRDDVEEARVLKKLNPNGEKYMFVHDDPSRGFVFNPNNPNGFRVIKNDPSEDLFNMVKVLEGAEEIHCMESSFRCLIDHLPNIKCPLYLHKGVRADNNGNVVISGSRKNWIVV